MNIFYRNSIENNFFILNFVFSIQNQISSDIHPELVLRKQKLRSEDLLKIRVII